MTISSTTVKNSYSGNGTLDTFNYTFKVFADADIQVIIRDASATETVKTLTTHYTVTGAGSASGGTIVFTAGNIPSATETVVIRRASPQTQAIDYIANDPFPAESHEEGLDRSMMAIQQLQEEIDRSIKLSRTNTMTSTEFTIGDTDRAGKVFGFDASGELTVAQELGTFKGNWSTSTAFAVRDIIKDTSNNNVYICLTAHTSSGSQPISTNTDVAKWGLLVDAASATTSANASAASAAAALVSENNSATSESNASASEASALSHKNDAETAKTAAELAETNAETAQTAAEAAQSAAEATFDLFDDTYLGAKASNPTVDNDGNALQDGALYFDTTNDVMKVYNLANTTWYQLTPTVSNQTNINTVAGISSDVTSVANISSDVTTVAGISSNVTSVANDATDIGTVATDIANVNTVAGISGNVTTVAGISGNVTSVANDATDIGSVAANIANVNAVASNETNINAVNANSSNINTVAGINADVTSVAGDATDIGTVATNLTGTDTIGTVAGSITNVNNVGGSIANVNTVATNLSGVNSFAERYRVASSDPSSSLDEGDLAFNTTDNNLKFYNGSSWTSIAPGIANVVDDSTPQLGGDLDLNSNDITGTGNINITGSLTTSGAFYSNGGNINSGNSLRFNRIGTQTSGLHWYQTNNNEREAEIEFSNTENLMITNLTSKDIYLRTNDAPRVAIKGNGDISFYEDTGTTPKFFWDASTERLGIGTTTPNAPLDIRGTDSSIRLGNAAQYFRIQHNDSANALVFNDNDLNERMHIDSSGNVGIGTAPNANAKFHIRTSNGRNLYVRDGYRTVGGIAIQTVNNAESANVPLELNADAETLLLSGTPITFTNSGTERMRIDSSGNVGIGTTSIPYITSNRSVLGINGSTDSIFAMQRGGGNNFYVHNTATQTAFVNTSALPITFGTNSTERMRIDSSGNLKFNSGYGSVATAYGVRAWVQYNAASAIVGSGNVSSITDNGTGNHTVNFATNMPDANYAVVTAAQEVNTNTNIISAGFNSLSTSSVQILTASNAAPGALDVINCIAIIR